MLYLLINAVTLLSSIFPPNAIVYIKYDINKGHRYNILYSGISTIQIPNTIVNIIANINKGNLKHYFKLVILSLNKYINPPLAKNIKQYKKLCLNVKLGVTKSLVKK